MDFNKMKEEYRKAQYYVSIGQGYSDAEARAIAYEEDKDHKDDIERENDR